MAYKGIMENKLPFFHPTLSMNIHAMREVILCYSGTNETDASIWMSIRNPSICPKVRQFLFKSIHGIYRMGEF